MKEMRQSERFLSLSLFASIYGIGLVTARKLYDRGLHSLRDLEAYDEVDTDITPVEPAQLHKDLILTCGTAFKTRVETSY